MNGLREVYQSSAYLSRGKRSFVRRCGMERVVFERMADQDQHHWWFVARRRILAEVTRRVVRPPQGARLLEVGCGTGHNLGMLAQFGKLDACELDAVARGLASDRLGRPVLEARLPDLSMFDAGSYD